MAAVAKNRPWGSNSSFSHITRKRKQLSKFREILGRSARQDLSAVQFSWRSVNLCRCYCPFYVAILSNFSALTFNNSKTKAAIEILRHLRSFTTTRSICYANFSGDLCIDVGVIALLMPFFWNFLTLTFNISESIISREVIQIGICWFWSGEHDSPGRFRPCELLASLCVRRRPSSSSVNFFKNLLLWNHWTDFLET